jgi:hypothetical protein
MNEELQKEIRNIVKNSLFAFADAQINLNSDSCREVLSRKITSDILVRFVVANKEEDSVYEMT